MQSGPTKALVQIHWCWPWLSLMQAPSFSQGFGRQGSISVKRRNRGLWNLNFWWSPKLQPSHIKICPSEGLDLNHDNDYCWWWNETEENKTPQKTRRTTLYQPLMHMMSVIHGLLPSQNSPTLPAGQLHVKLSVVVWQVPPYLQGFG